MTISQNMSKYSYQILLEKEQKGLKLKINNEWQGLKTKQLEDLFLSHNIMQCPWLQLHLHWAAISCIFKFNETSSFLKNLSGGK